MPPEFKNNTSMDLPLEQIAIAFSGGGFRAASFSLGTLSYLEYLKIDDRPAIERVHFSSSTSGGTITNLLFTASRHKREPFIDFYRQTLNLLSGQKLINSALEILNDDDEWKPDKTSKQRNLINAFSRIYDRDFFGKDANQNPVAYADSTMAIFWKGEEKQKYEVCFNSTEFYRGLSFRFRTTGEDKPMGKIGNQYLYFDQDLIDAYKKIKLGDVLAASSCFPAGFEPIVYPADFVYSQLTSEELSDSIFYTNYDLETQRLSNVISNSVDNDPKQKLYIKAFSLMDGGITDNQGLKSLMDADIYRSQNNLAMFDLILVTDVTSYFMDNFEPSPLDNETKWLKKSADNYVKIYQPWLEAITPIQCISVLITILGLVIASLSQFPTPLRLIGSGLGTSSLLVFIVICFLNSGKGTGVLIKNLSNFNFSKWFTSIVPLRKSFTPAILELLISYLKNTKLNTLEQMLKNRLRSVMTMVLDVNLKQVRRLIFDLFWEDSRWENRRQSNFIYDLSTHNKNSREERVENIYKSYDQEVQARTDLTPNDKQTLQNSLNQDKDLLLKEINQMSYIAERAREVGTTLWYEDTPQGESISRDVVMTGQFTTCANLLEYCLSLKAKNVLISPKGKMRLDSLIKQLTADFNRFKINPDFLWEHFNSQILDREKFFNNINVN